MESALSASSDEVEWTGAAGTVKPCKDDASSDSKASLEPNAPSQPVVDPDGV